MLLLVTENGDLRNTWSGEVADSILLGGKLLKMTQCFYFAPKGEPRNIGGQYFAASRFPALSVPSSCASS